MTEVLSVKDVAGKIEAAFPGSIVESSTASVLIKSDFLLPVAKFLKETPELDFNYLNYVTAVDYYEYFEVVYQLASIANKGRTVMLKTRCYGRENPAVSSVVSVWQGADFQEREIYDLMGIRFEGHPNMKRIFLWEGFQGHPLRKDFNGA